MLRNDTQVKTDPRGGADPSDSFASLTRTLEDLEARLTRLSSGKPQNVDSLKAADPASLDAAAPETPVERLRQLAATRRAARRMGLASEVSAMTVERQLAHGAATRAAQTPRLDQVEPALMADLGAVAGELQALQSQDATIALVKELAGEVRQLRGEIQAQAPEQLSVKLDEFRASFADLRSMIAGRENPDRIGTEIFEVMEQLAELTAGTADQASLEALRTELDGVAALLGDLAREESIQAVQQRWDAFETRLGDRMELDLQAKRDLRVELERLRGSLRSLATEEQILAVQQRWEEFESRYVEGGGTFVESRVADLLRGELDALRGRLDAVLAAQAGDAERLAALEARLDPSVLEAAVERLGERMGEIEQALVGLPDLLQLDELEQRIEALAQGVESLSDETRRADLEHFEAIERRLNDIGAALVTVSARTVELDMAPIERIEARIAQLANRVDGLSGAQNNDVLSEQIAALSAKVEELAGRGDADLAGRMDGLSERVEALLASRNAAAPDVAAFEKRIAVLAERLEAANAGKTIDSQIVQALEEQIQHLSERLAGAAAALPEDDGEIVRRLDAVERQIDETREQVVVAARTAADEAVRKMQAENAEREGKYVRDLAEDLRKLEALCRDTDERSLNVFDAVHATLTKIVERLTAIETEMRKEATAERHVPSAAPIPTAAPTPIDTSARIEWAAARASASQTQTEEAPKGLRAAIAQQFARRRSAKAKAKALPVVDRSQTLAQRRGDLAFEAPSLDPSDSLMAQEANRPLEPGSGAPNIAALLERVRNQQNEAPAIEPAARADFIAAARKAAVAAAAEAETLRGSDEVAEGEPGERVGRRRKPILMAVGAVLLALMALPLGRVFLSEGGERSQTPIAAHTPSVEQSPVPEEQAAKPAEPVAAPQETASDVAVRSEAQGPSIPEPLTAPDALNLPPLPMVPKPATMAATPASADMGDMVATPVAAQIPADATSVPPAAPLASAASPSVALPAVPAGIGNADLLAAVEAGEPKALFEVGLRLLEGRVGASDPVAAMTWFTAAAERGFAPAQYSVGTLYEKGNGVERDLAAARNWYEQSAEQGNIRAMHNLAVLYATGVDGNGDPSQAAEWFLKAAEHGMRDSQYNLGILYARGAGLERNLGESYRWFSIVGKSGDQDAKAKGEEVAKSLAPDLRARIDAEVAAWKPQDRIDAANAVEIPASWSDKSDQTASIDTNRAIRNIQAILIKLGYDPGTPDGIVGAQTTEAIRAFQKNAGLSETGKIDEPLIRALLQRKDA